MISSSDLKRRALELSSKTNSETIAPTEVGGLAYDTLEYIEDVERNGGSLGIRKTYATVSAMEADSNPVDDKDGTPLRRGMLVNIYNQDDASAPDNGKVFSWQNPGWQLRTKLDAGYATTEQVDAIKTEQDEKLSELANEQARISAAIYSNDLINLSEDESTNHPKIIPISNGDIYSTPKIQVDNTDNFPLKSYTNGFYRKITLLGENQNSFYINYDREESGIPIGEKGSRPTVIQISSWYKKEHLEILLSQSEKMDYKLFGITPNVAQHTYLTKELISNLGNKTQEQIVNNSSGEYINSCKIQSVYVDNVAGWCKVATNIYDISWKEMEYTYMKWTWQISGIKESIKNLPDKTFYLATFCIIHNGFEPAGVQSKNINGTIKPYPISLKSQINTIEEENNKIDNRVKELENKLLPKKNILTVKFNEGEDNVDIEVSLKSYFNEKYDIVNKGAFLHRYLKRNENWNWDRTLLINRNTGEEINIHGTSDDRCPANYNGTYIGGGHGDGRATNVSCPSHDKTYADIGSIWNNGQYDFTLLRIIDENNLLFFSSKSYNDVTWDYKKISTGETLQHVSGAIHQSNIAVNIATSTQLHSGIVSRCQKIYADGNEIKESGTYEVGVVDLIDDYDVIVPHSICEQITAQKPEDGYTSNPFFQDLKNLQYVANHSIIYRFLNAATCLVFTDFYNYKKINLSYFGFIQSGVMPNIQGGNIYMYVPKVLPFEDGKTYDFRTIERWNAEDAPNGTKLINTSFFENPNLPPDRAIEFTGTSNIDRMIGFHHGFVFDRGIGGNKRKDNIRNCWFFPKTRKSYIYGIDSLLNIDDGNYDSKNKSSVCFRQYCDCTKNPDGRINNSSFEIDGKLYLYLDYNKEIVDFVTLDDKWKGKLITILEKSDNICVLNETVTTGIKIRVSNNAPMYGYCVILIE